MARQNIEATDTLNAGRLKINANDTEEYADIAAAVAAAAQAQGDATAAASTASTAQTAANNAQTNIDTHEALTNNPHSVTQTQVGLGNVDNTSDLNKPISTATQAALDTVTKVLVTGAIALDSTAFGKVHFCSGTSADYTITLPTAVGNEGKMLLFKGDSLVANLNKAVTIDGAGTELLDQRLVQIISTAGRLSLIARVTAGVGSWDVVEFDQGFPIAWTPTLTGLSGATLDYKYKLVNSNTLMITMFHVTGGTGGGATQYTFTLPNSWTPYGNQKFAVQVFNNAAFQVGLVSFVNANNVVTTYSTIAQAAWVNSAADREVIGTAIININ